MAAPMRDSYGKALAELGEKNPNVVALDADVSSSTKSSLFGKRFPERFFNVGVSEANMAGMAAGMALKGKIPFIHCFAAFMMLRAADPIRTLACYQNLNVKICGTYAGLSDSYDGPTHHSISDIAFFRALPNLTVVVASDGVEAGKAVFAAAEHQGPVYLRISRAPVEDVFKDDYDFRIGRAVQLTDGNDVSIISTGYMTTKALEAARILKQDGINARVINMHTIKPLDVGMIRKCVAETGALVTAEEHSIVGGLGGAVAEAMATHESAPLEMVGLRDTFAETGDYESLLNKYGLCGDGIAERAKLVLKRK